MKKVEKKNQLKEKLTFSEKLKDKRERAKIELIAYCIFFVAIIIGIKVMGFVNKNNPSNNIDETSFISSIKDNYEYDIKITLNNQIYEYYGKVLGNNSTINLKSKEEINSYQLRNQKYYALEDGNYILTEEKEVYPYIEYRYMNINNIKQYIQIATKENNIYKVKLSDIILNYESDEYMIITIDEGDKSVVVDYTPVYKLIEKDTERLIVNLTFNNIDKIISLEE